MSSSTDGASSSTSSVSPIHRTLDANGFPVTLPPLTPDKEALLLTSYQRAYKECLSDGASDGWIYNSTQEEIQIYTKQVEGQPTEWCKGVGYVDAAPIVISTIWNSLDWRKEWDGMFLNGETIEQLDPYTEIGYAAFGAPWPVSGRDFASMSRTLFLPKEDIPSLMNSTDTSLPTVPGVFSFSIDYAHKKCPPKKGLVRGILMFCGLWIESVEGNPNRSRVIYTLGSDPCGSIPKSIVNGANVKQPLCIAAVRNVLVKNAKVKREVLAAIETEKKKAAERRALLTQQTQPQQQEHLEQNGNGVKTNGTITNGSNGNIASSSSSSAASISPSASSVSSSPSSSIASSSSIDMSIEPPLPPSPYDHLLSQCYANALSAVQAEGNSDGWIFNSTQEGIEIYMKTLPGSTVNMCKGVGVLQYPADIVQMVFADNKYRTKWDEICTKAETVRTLDWSTVINYTSFSAPWPVSARDFLAVSRTINEPLGKEKSPGVVFVFSASIDDLKLKPVPKGIVRGTLHYAGLWIQPLTPNSCKIIYTLSSDPNGSIPKGLVNAANVKQPLCIANVGKVIAKYPDIIELMKEERKKKKELGERMMMEERKKMGGGGGVAAHKVNGSNGHHAASNSTSSSASSSSAPSPSHSKSSSSTDLTSSSSSSSASTSHLQSFSYVSTLLRSLGPFAVLNTTTQSNAGFFVNWEGGERVKELSQQEMILQAEEELEKGDVTWKWIVWVMILSFFRGMCKRRKKGEEQQIEEQEDESFLEPSSNGSVTPPTTPAVPSAPKPLSRPLVGILSLELLDLRQLVATLQTQHLQAVAASNSQSSSSSATNSADNSSRSIPSLLQTVYIHLELEGQQSSSSTSFISSSDRQGQVCQAVLDLSTGTCCFAPTTLQFRITHPDAVLVMSCYTQNLDIVYSNPFAVPVTHSSMSQTVVGQHTAQNITGKLRNLVNPLAITASIGDGLEAGLDSFLHVFDSTQKAVSESTQNLQHHAKIPHPIVLQCSTRLSVRTDLSAPDSEHARIAWVELADEYGLHGTNVATMDSLLTSYAHGGYHAHLSGAGSSHHAGAAGGARPPPHHQHTTTSTTVPPIKRQNSNLNITTLLAGQSLPQQYLHHPTLQTSPTPIYSLLLHSRYRTTERAAVRAYLEDVPNTLLLGSSSSSVASSTPQQQHYTILFQTMEGIFDLIRFSSEHREVALWTYERLTVGGAAAMKDTGSNLNNRSAPILGSKLLLSCSNHILHGSYYDIQRKRDLFSYGRTMLRAELLPCLASIDSDVMYTNRRVTRGIHTVAIAARKETKTLHTTLDPYTHLHPILFVAAYHSLFATLREALLLVITLGRLYLWSDVYHSFFACCTFIWMCFFPSFILPIGSCLVILTLARNAAMMYFETNLLSHVGVEYEKKKRRKKERMMRLIAQFTADVGSGLSQPVQRGLYFLQALSCYLTQSSRPLVSLFTWLTPKQTMNLIVVCCYATIVSLIFPFTWTLILILLFLSCSQFQWVQLLIHLQAGVLQYYKQARYQRERCVFPVSNIALQTMAVTLAHQKMMAAHAAHNKH